MLASLLISEAYAQTAGSPPAGDLLQQMLLPIILIGAMFFLMVRPQMKRAKEQTAMLKSLQKGDEVIAGGILGKVTNVGDTYVSIEIADKVIIQVQKGLITTPLPKGTIKSA
ncbi:MAG: preprotein translocase subunit YajC [Burkholderiales bacterium]